jgi:hypothetical protein
MNTRFAERQPQILRLRPLRRTPLRMTDRLLGMADQLLSELQIQDPRTC